MDTRTREAIRYLGYGKHQVDEKVLQLIRESFEDLEKTASPKMTYCICPVSFPKAGKVIVDSFEIASKSLYKNLYGCREVVLFGTTLGAVIDARIRKQEVVDMSHAVIYQACAAAYLEEYCDNMQEELSRMLKEKKQYLRPRFSPGYGDFSVLHQKDILGVLEAPKRIGLTMTDGYMLTPTKSVTALIGISNTKEPCHKKGCEECEFSECAYRRS